VFSHLNSSSRHTGQQFTIGVSASAAFFREIEPACSGIKDVKIHAVSLRSVLKHAAIDLFICEMPDEFDVLRTNVMDVQEAKPVLPIIVVTHAAAYDVGVALLRMKVADFLVLPDDQRRLYALIENFAAERKARLLQQEFLDHKTTVSDFDQIIGQSPQLLETFRLTRKVIASDYMTALVLGETGTGKELLVKVIHYNSSNREHPFVEINCSAIPETLLEAELFGYEKGAFTDARDRKIGLFELAGKGTIFLDEIGDVNMLVQSKLLKVIEEKVMRRLGGVENIPVHARIIAATSKNLEDLVHKGLFRQDLYFRLHILPLLLPPLRDRENDIPILCEYFLAQFNAVHHKSITGITREAMAVLMKHPWRGNIRELKHAMERAVVLCDDAMLDVTSFDLKSGAHRPHAVSAAHDDHSFSMDLHKTSLVEMEQRFASEVLRSVNGNKSQAASVLAISRPRLDRILKQPVIKKKRK
jgi:two-component system, NtrC family, response regulator AtoC